MFRSYQDRALPLSYQGISSMAGSLEAPASAYPYLPCGYLASFRRFEPRPRIPCFFRYRRIQNEPQTGKVSHVTTRAIRRARTSSTWTPLYHDSGAGLERARHLFSGWPTIVDSTSTPPQSPVKVACTIGAGGESRTRDLSITNRGLCRLSYTSKPYNTYHTSNMERPVGNDPTTFPLATGCSATELRSLGAGDGTRTRVKRVETSQPSR